MSRTFARLGLATAVVAAFLGSAPAHADDHIAIAAICPGYITIENIQAPAYLNCLVDTTAALVVAEATCVSGYDPLTPATVPNAQSETNEYVACAA